jgi:hypothetical protein
MPRWVFVLSKFTAQLLVYTSAFLVGGLTAYYCIVVLFGAVDVLLMIKINLLLDDVTRMDSITGDFDLILDMGCYHSLPSKARSHYSANLDRFLTSDGTYLLYVFKTK